MSREPMTEATGRLLCKRMADLAVLIQGLTGAILEQGPDDEPDEEAVPVAYLDGSPRMG